MEAWHPWAAAFFVASLFAARLWARDALARWRLARRRRVAAQGEVDAERLLAKHGYRIVARQPARTLRYERDGAAVEVTVRPDLLVARAGRRWVAEVKTGSVAPKLETRSTRRQLLEYAHAFDGEVDGLLLVDATRSRVHRLRLPRRRAPLGRGALALALTAGVVAGILLAEAARAP